MRRLRTGDGHVAALLAMTVVVIPSPSRRSSVIASQACRLPACHRQRRLAPVRHRERSVAICVSGMRWPRRCAPRHDGGGGHRERSVAPIRHRERSVAISVPFITQQLQNLQPMSDVCLRKLRKTPYSRDCSRI